MTDAALVGVGVAGAIGAPARYVIDRAITRRRSGPFPVGTFVVNVSGSLLLGLLVGAALYHGFSGAPRAWLATGFCGAYTTFSTFGLETVALGERAERRTAGAYVAASTIIGCAAAAAGLAIAAAL
ncbi:MAG: fluoride exporter [Actinomycetota bacterium]|nr:fluoride exporter [Actinomycetota bacterium]